MAGNLKLAPIQSFPCYTTQYTQITGFLWPVFSRIRTEQILSFTGKYTSEKTHFLEYFTYFIIFAEFFLDEIAYQTSMFFKKGDKTFQNNFSSFYLADKKN